jgi:hypothetical protein
VQFATLAICPKAELEVSMAAHCQGSSTPFTKKVLVPEIPNPPNSASV